jgi:hypothetical protein
LVLTAMLPSLAAACPFCTALKPTLSQRREEAQAAALGEFAETSEGLHSFRLHAVQKGEAIKKGEVLRIAVDGEFKPGALAILFAVEMKKSGSASAAEQTWTAVPVDELSYAYFARAPSLREETAKRLRYFAIYLEHRDPAIAEDAYLEFAHATYADTAEVADTFDEAKLRAWLTSERVPPERKGFYGLALGLADEPKDSDVSNAEFLKALLAEAAVGSGFQSGLDGVMGGYLVAAGEPALAEIDRRFLADPTANVGHVRHAMNALRFYYEFGRDIPAARLRESLRKLLARPEFAAETVTDLARWEDWDSLAHIADLYVDKRYEERPTKRAIISYLLVCPLDEAQHRLEQIRKLDPTTVAEAERSLELFGDR